MRPLPFTPSSAWDTPRRLLPLCRWIEERCDDLAPDGTLQTMYGLDGRHNLTEFELPHLEGYQGSKPVRVGNAAHQQLQLDIYGELMDSVYLYDKYGKPISHDLWKNLVRLVDWLCDNWQKPDNGIWEVRGGQREFLYSRLMSWVAIDRALRLAEKRSFPAPLERWHAVRDEIYNDIFDNFWNDETRRVRPVSRLAGPGRFQPADADGALH